MNSKDPLLESAEVRCDNCEACCYRLEVMLISETGVPHYYIEQNEAGSSVMSRLEDGWCVALDRTTMKCTIYDKRPWVCREFEMGSYECVVERRDYL